MKSTIYEFILLICVLWIGQTQSVGISPDTLPPAEKIDPLVQAKMDSVQPIPVTILCRTQFLETPHGFGNFCRNHSTDKRSDLRGKVIEELKAIASNGEQQAVIMAAGRVGVDHHWIINALTLRLQARQILKVAQLDEVKYIYAGFPNLPRQRKAQLAEVIPYERREAMDRIIGKIPWNLQAIRADRVWKEKNTAGDGVIVAMLEGGVDYTHQDLRKNIWINQKELPNNGKDDDENGWIDDYYGFNFRTGTCELISRIPQHHHGTMTSGIVAGDGTGGIITGVAPRARIMPLSGHAVYAYQYALEQGADILSMSFSIPNLGNGRGLFRLMSEQAVCAGLVLVSGCGNFQQSAKIPEQIRVPEGIPCVIGAGGVDRSLEVPKFCSLGPVEWESVKFYEDYPMPMRLTKPDISAFPGPGYPQLAPNDGKYIQNKRGNSFSGPHIAGVAALMFSVAPELPAWRIKDIMEETARDIGAEGKDNRTGAGLVGAWKAVLAAEAAVGL